jgi:putative flippase GtrA
MTRFLRYALVGALATAVHYATLALCVEWRHWPAGLASGFGALVGAQVAFFGNRWFTFERRGSLPASWLRFHVTALLGAAQGMLVVWAGVAAGWHYLAAQVLATLLSLLLTYAVNKAWTFR